MGEHRPYKPGVTGSSPVPPTRNCWRNSHLAIYFEPMAATGNRLSANSKTTGFFGGVVQFGLERRPVTPEVASSSLVAPAIIITGT